MKKLILSVSVLAFLALSVVASNGDDKKKECKKDGKACCKKGDNTQGKACAGMDGKEAKACCKKDGAKSCSKDKAHHEEKKAE